VEETSPTRRTAGKQAFDCGTRNPQNFDLQEKKADYRLSET